jgi:hypothetical protein
MSLERGDIASYEWAGKRIGGRQLLNVSDGTHYQRRQNIVRFRTFDAAFFHQRRRDINKRHKVATGDDRSGVIERLPIGVYCKCLSL